MNTVSKSKRPTISKLLSDLALKVAGWKIVGEFPDLPKYILVGAPHTSNWDFVLVLLLKFSTGLGFHWIGKDSLFRPPYGWFFRLTGGIPVYRDRRQNFVEQMVENFINAERLLVAISPEGTRSKSRYWKTGFYYIAVGANIPILLIYVDYIDKEVGVGPLIYTSGDIYADFEHIREFFSQKTGLYPEEQGAIELKPREDSASSP